MSLFSCRFRVSWSDIDNSGSVHYSNYLRYCEKVEEEFLNTLNLDFNGVTAETISLISIVGGQPPLPQSSVLSLSSIYKIFGFLFIRPARL